jgi:uncharacterized protein YjbJ (UPF0337 family)
MISYITKGIFMNWDIVEGNWKQFKGKVRSRWGKLTDDQLDLIAGKRTELAGKIQEAYGVTKDEVEMQIKLFEEQIKDLKPSAKI